MNKVDCVCSDCGRGYKMLSMFVDNGTATCVRCGSSVVRKPKSGNRGSAIQKRSKAQEKGASKRYDMEIQPASGSMEHAKGDLRRRGGRRGECKYTAAKSFTLKKSVLEKIEEEALGDEIPFLEIEFQDFHPYRRYVVLPDWAFKELIER